MRQGKYKPQPVRRKEIPKPDGGVRKLGISTVVDRIIQQAIAGKPTGTWSETAMCSEQSQQKDSHRPDTTVSLTGTSLCTYAIEPTCTERYARWCERSGLFSPSYSIGEKFFRGEGEMYGLWDGKDGKVWEKGKEKMS